MILTTKEDFEKAVLNGEEIKTQTVFYTGYLDSTESARPSIGSLYKGGIYIGEYNGKEVVMMLNDEEEEMTWDDAMKLKHRRPLSVLEWQLYRENKRLIDEALEKYGEPLQCNKWYWSSSVLNNESSWGIILSDGDMLGSIEDCIYRVRCVQI